MEIFVTLEEIRKATFGLYKYVLMRDGSFRFCNACEFNHYDLVQGLEKEFVTKAGTIKVRDGKFDIYGYGSTTLKIEESCNAEELAKILQMEYDLYMM